LDSAHWVTEERVSLQFSYLIRKGTNFTYIYEYITFFLSMQRRKYFINLSYKINWKKIIVQFLFQSILCDKLKIIFTTFHRQKKSNIFTYVCKISSFCNEIWKSRFLKIEEALFPRWLNMLYPIIRKKFFMETLNCAHLKFILFLSFQIKDVLGNPTLQYRIELNAKNTG
jgi:hypothetical protein